MLRSPRAGVRYLSVLALLGLVAHAGARADEPDPEEVEIVTTDGTRYVGRVVSETDAQVALEVRRGGVRGEVTIPRGEISSTTRRGGEDPIALMRAQRAEAARQLVEPTERAAALVRLGEEAEAEGQPAAAAPLFLEAGVADPSLAEQTEVCAARALIAAGKTAEAEHVVRRALERNPKNAQAAVMARRLHEAFEQKARELIEPGVQAWADGDARRALRLLTRAAEELPRSALDQASARVQADTGLTLPQLMVDCRLRTPCGPCDGAGAVECPGARSTVSTRCRFGRVFDVTDVRRSGGVEHAASRWCHRCNGLGATSCDACSGTGLSLGRPTEYEREELLTVLGEQLKGLEERAAELGGKAEADGAEVSIRSVLVSELLSTLQGIRVHTEAITRLDPRAGAIGGGDLRRKDRAASQRQATVMTMLANALYLAGERRFEDALGGSGDAQHLPAADRAARARQSWELVRQARIYMLEALELSPGSAAATAGDLRNRLHLCERFLDRSWRTYVSLRAMEQRLGADDTLADRLLKRLLEGAGLQGGGPGGGVTGGGVSGGVSGGGFGGGR